jgi:hypothetical protein
VNNRYVVDVFLQQAIDFNISYPYEGFNRTYPMLFTTDVNDGTNFIQQDCNATSFTDTTITFDCPDMGNMCTENTENSGYVQTINGADYMVNSIAGGKYFLQGRYTSEPTGQPTGQPTGEPTGAPTVEPTGKPSGQPTVEPTGAPTVVPTGEPTAFPTFTDAEVVVLAVSQQLLNPAITAAIFDDEVYLTPFRETVATIIGDIRPEDVTVTNITDIKEGRNDRRRLAFDDPLGVRVDYDVTATVQAIGAANLTSAIQQVEDALDDSASGGAGDGSFMTTLIARATSAGVSDVITAFSAATVSQPDAVIVTAVNTDMPTSHPTAGPTALPVDDDDNFPTIEVALPLSVIGFFGIAGLFYWMYLNQRTGKGYLGGDLTTGAEADAGRI